MTSNQENAFGAYAIIKSKEKNEQIHFICVKDIDSNMDGQEVFLKKKIQTNFFEFYF